ncbi:fluoride efflux transporter CrcB [Lihuaxuella thermophila]|uniref:Fluoride-specific ion channel FluC n=1 Tax=Lihuaxuella thermophila TaxID=1173111 RepID=A0A1H8ICD8_9BACL|nr:fluoride efflux transporter CrcB [Lihuaxuella thermophila]SEN66453.1 CrcB protein [Lihuaxuella thermophila]
MKPDVWIWAMTGFAGSLGAVARYMLSEWVRSLTTRTFPLATFLINGSGSFLFGIVWGWNPPAPFQESWPHAIVLLTTGFLGGYTTFSTFGVECAGLIQKKDWGTAMLYILLSVSLSLGATFLGWRIVR